MSNVLPSLRDGVSTGWVAEHKAFEENYEHCTGKAVKFDPQIFDYAPCGSRILVCREEAESELRGSGIQIPDSVQERNPPGAGYIAVVGDMVGSGTAPHPHGVHCKDPSKLLYKRIIFGMFSGKEFTTRSYADGGFKTAFWILTDRDIWFIDWGAGKESYATTKAGTNANLLDSTGRNDDYRTI